MQPLLLSYAVQLLAEQRPDLLVPAHLLVRCVHVLLGSQLQHFLLVRGDDGDGKVLVRLPVQEHLRHQMALRVNGLHLLRRYVLPLLQFEDVFLTVNDLHGVGVW